MASPSAPQMQTSVRGVSKASLAALLAKCGEGAIGCSMFDRLVGCNPGAEAHSFFQRIERLELETRRLAGIAGEGPGASSARRQIVSDVGTLRHAGEIKSYIDLLFLALVVLLCVSKIVTD